MNPKERAQKRILSQEETLLAISHQIHANPELGFEEVMASELLSEYARSQGFDVELGVGGLPTAFVATLGSGKQTVALCAEYDALPEIGHACGHNVIAASTMAAAVGLASVADDCDLTVRIIGTPAEEVGEGAGKTILLEHGVFDGVDFAMMVHPAPEDILRPVMMAAATLDIEYRGTPSHAAFYPELGVNAADALTLGQVAVGLARQHILPTDRVHGIVLKGGDAPNIVPAHTTARFLVRSLELADLPPLVERVSKCFEAGAVGTGAELNLEGGNHPYADVRHHDELSNLYRSNAEHLGRVFESGGDRPSGSTDMGNVSHVIPSIHPFIGIGSFPAVNHQPGFTAAAAGPKADQAVLDAGVGLAWTAVDYSFAETN